MAFEELFFKSILTKLDLERRTPTAQADTLLTRQSDMVQILKA